MKSLRSILGFVAGVALVLAALPSAAIPLSDSLILSQGGIPRDVRTIDETQEPMTAPAVIDSTTPNLLLYGAPTLIYEGTILSDVVGVVNGTVIRNSQPVTSEGLGFI